MEDWQRLLVQNYSRAGHPIAFAGPQKVYAWLKEQGVPVSLAKVREWLQSREEYSLTRETRKPRFRPRVHVSHMGLYAESDLADMKQYSSDNSGYKYILVVIDQFSRYVLARGLRDKNNNTVVRELSSILDESPPFRYMLTDRGKEYTGRVTQTFFKERGVKHFTSEGEMHAARAERVIKTLKGRLTRYMIHRQKMQWYDILADIVKSYNNTIHRSIGRAPAEVTPQNEAEVLEYMLRLKAPPVKRERPKRVAVQSRPFRLKVRDHVRLSQLKERFDRHYSQHWSGEIFVIVKRVRREGRPFYKVSDIRGEEITGIFAPSELQKVRYDENKAWKIEKVLKRRGKGKKQELLVKWLHWPSKYNSWVEASVVQSQKRPRKKKKP